MRRILVIPLSFLIGCAAPEPSVQQLIAADARRENSDRFPIIIESPVRLLYAGQFARARILTMQFAQPDPSKPEPAYAFGLLDGWFDGDYERDAKRLRLNNRSIFIHKCFETPRQIVEYWPIIVGGRVSAGSEGSEFIFEMDGPRFNRLYYVTASKAKKNIYLTHENGNNVTLDWPGQYAYLVKETLANGKVVENFKVKDFTRDPELLPIVQRATELADLAGIRCACKRCPAVPLRFDPPP